MSILNATGARGIRWVAPLALIFLLGGTVQYAGLLSQTQTNWLALLLLAHVFLLRSAWRQAQRESPLLLLLGLVIAAQLLHGTPIAYTLTYSYYLICTFVAAIAGRTYAERAAVALDMRAFFAVARNFLVLQLAVTLLQALFTEQFVAYSMAPIGDVDAIFGTFFLQSDAALAAVCELLVAATFFLPCRRSTRVFISALALGIVFLGNSNTARVALVLTLMLLSGHAVYRRLGLGRQGFNVLLVSVGLAIVAVLYSPITDLIGNFLIQAVEDYDNREAWESASRFAPLGQIYAEGFNLLGRGALTYYNPITKEWLYNSGFSTFYSLYLDFGFVGAFLYIVYQVSLIFRFVKSFFERGIFILILISFAMFNFALTDLAFNVAFNFVVYLIYRHRQSTSPGHSPDTVRSGRFAHAN